MNQASILSKF